MYVNKYHGWRWHVGGFIQGIASILDGIVMAATFGFCGLGAQLFVARHRALWNLRFLKEQAKKNAEG